MDVETIIREFNEKEQYHGVTDLCHIMRKHDCDKGLGVHNYSTIYDKLFKNMREKPISFLEIGHHTYGSSLPAWREYFTKARILGMDASPVEVQGGRIETYVMDQKSPRDIERVMGKIGSVDVILDDAVHDFDYNWELIQSMMKYLKPGGMYIVEDLTVKTRDKFRPRLEELRMRFQLEMIEIVEIPYIRNDYNDNRILVMKRQEEMQLTIVTAASQIESKMLIELICSLIVRKVRYKKMIIYDMGLDPATLFLLKDMFPMQRLLIRSFDYSMYPPNLGTWKSMILEEVVMNKKENDHLLWLDASTKHLNMTDLHTDTLCKVEPVQGTNIGSLMDQDLLEYFKIHSTDQLLEKPRIDKSKIHFRVNPDTIDMISEWSNLVQSNIGKGSDIIFDILYYRLAKQVRESEKFTIRGRTDDFGGQYTAIMSAVAYCEHAGMEYVHTPFSEIHPYPCKSSEIAEFNRFIGIPPGKNFAEVKRGEVFANLVVGSEDKGYYTSSVMKTLRDFYYSTPKPSVPEVDIAIHICRGSISPSDQERYTPNDVYQRILAMLRVEYPAYTIHIYSEDCADMFSDVSCKETEIEFHTLTPENTRTTFHSLVMAKVLVVARSPFSYAAGILNQNEVYCFTNFLHKPLPGWHRLTH